MSMKMKTWNELPITIDFDVETPEPDVGIFHTSVDINQITIMGYDVTELFDEKIMRGFEDECLEYYQDEMQNNMEAEADYRNDLRKDSLRMA